MKKILIGSGIVGVIFFIPIFLLLLFSSSTAASSNDCDSSSTLNSGGVRISSGFKDDPIDKSHVYWDIASEEQKKNAQTIKDEVSALHGDDKHLLVTMIVAIDESEIIALHSGDRDSLGIFQQRANWGPADKREDPKWSTDRFLTNNTKPNGEGAPGYLDLEKSGQITKDMDPWKVAQTIQQSGTGDGSNYKKVMGNAEDIIKNLGGSTCGGGSAGKGDDYPFKINKNYPEGCLNAHSEVPVRVVTPLESWVCQCTDFVAWRLNQKAGGTKDNIKWANVKVVDAGSWPSAYPEIAHDNNPKVGDAAIIFGSPGHVAYVTKVEGSKVSVEQYNSPNAQDHGTYLSYSTQTTDKSYWNTFMHFGDKVKPNK